MVMLRSDLESRYPNGQALGADTGLADFVHSLIFKNTEDKKQELESLGAVLTKKDTEKIEAAEWNKVADAVVALSNKYDVKETRNSEDISTSNRRLHKGDISRIVYLREQGYSLNSIARYLGIAESTIARYW